MKDINKEKYKKKYISRKFDKENIINIWIYKINELYYIETFIKYKHKLLKSNITKLKWNKIWIINMIKYIKSINEIYKWKFIEWLQIFH